MLKINTVMKKMGDWNIFLNVIKQKNWKDRIKYSTSNVHLHKLLSKYDYLEKSTKSPDKIISKIPNKLKHYFFRGILDGDGCFYVNEKNCSYQFHITSCYEQDWTYVEVLFKELGIDNYKIIRKKHENRANSFIRITDKKKIKKLGDFIYQNFDTDKIGLERKYKKYKIIEAKCK